MCENTFIAWLRMSYIVWYQKNVSSNQKKILTVDTHMLARARARTAVCVHPLYIGYNSYCENNIDMFKVNKNNKSF